MHQDVRAMMKKEQYQQAIVTLEEYLVRPRPETDGEVDGETEAIRLEAEGDVYAKVSFGHCPIS